MFNPRIADHIIQLEQFKGLPDEDGGVFDGLVTYIRSLFAVDFEALDAQQLKFIGRPPRCSEGDEATLRAIAYCEYIAILASQDSARAAESAALAYSNRNKKAMQRYRDTFAGCENVDTWALIEYEESIWFLQEALAIAGKHGIEIDDVVEYYKSRAARMPVPGTMEDTSAQQVTDPLEDEEQRRAA